MGFFGSLGAEGYDRQYTDRDLVRRILVYFKPHSRRLTMVGVMMLLVSLAGALAPILVARGIDLIAGQFTLQNITVISGLVLVTGLVTWGANWLRRRLTQRAVGDVVMQLRVDAFQASIEHDLSFYDEFASGRIVSRITSDTNEFAQVVVLITEVIAQLAQTLFLMVVLLQTDWRLSLMLFVFMPIVFVAALGFRRLARLTTRRGMQAMGNVNATIKETVSGISVAKNFRQELEVYNEFNESNQQSYQVNVRRGAVIALIFPTLNVINSLGTAVLVVAGGFLAAGGIVTVGSWYLFLISLDRFWFPVLNLSAFWPQIQSGLSAAERVFALVDAESAVNQTASEAPPRLTGDIQFKDLCFRYTDQEQVLDTFNLHIQPGETVALVGHTGSGKSSIARLIARFYEFQEGDLLIDGRDLRTFDLEAYRMQLGIVSQSPFLFSGSVIENIRYALPDATENDIYNLARQIGNGGWLDTLPDGLQTQVGERGGRLSMGQRQLVALLRVLVQSPSIFILDEATASIDPFTEWQIQQALNLVLANTTSILIAHRLSTVKAADRIIVLKNGRIIEEGDHRGLLDQGGHYAELYDTYFRYQSLKYIDAQQELAQGD